MKREEILPKFHPAVTPPEIWVKVLPKFVEWNSPTSVVTQTSPATVGWTRILLTAVADPRVTDFVKLVPELDET